MEVNIEDSWKRRLQPEFDKPYFYNLTNFVKEEYSKHTIYPPGKFIFHAFNTCPFDKVKVVIIGQDPYHEPGQYYGLCFSVLDGVPFPPSLLNIFINAILTVRAHQAGSHRGKGWEEFTDAVIKILNDEKENIVFMLWGSYAQRKGAFIDRNRHCVLTAAHPSPLSADRGFFGCKHFSKANQYFKSKGISEIEW